MTSNPLKARKSEGWVGAAPGIAFEDFPEFLNGLRQYRERNIEWFINTLRKPDGTNERYLDQRDHTRRKPYWDNPEREVVAATEAVTARYAATRMEQDKFNRLCDEGVISREVDALLERRRNRAGSDQTDPR